MTALDRARVRWQLHLPVVVHPCGCRWLTTIPPLPVPVRKVQSCRNHTVRRWWK